MSLLPRPQLPFGHFTPMAITAECRDPANHCPINPLEFFRVGLLWFSWNRSKWILSEISWTKRWRLSRSYHQTTDRLWQKWLYVWRSPRARCSGNSSAREPRSPICSSGSRLRSLGRSWLTGRYRSGRSPYFSAIVIPAVSVAHSAAGPVEHHVNSASADSLSRKANGLIPSHKVIATPLAHSQRYTSVGQVIPGIASFPFLRRVPDRRRVGAFLNGHRERFG